MENYVFFLGSIDGEMEEIKKFLVSNNKNFFDKNLPQGAKASDYGDEISEVATTGEIPVLIELAIDCNLPETVIIIDHHGDRAGEPPAIIQVLDLVGIEPTKDQIRVGAWDAAGREGLLALGLSYADQREFLGGKPPVIGGPKEGSIEYREAMKRIASDSYLGDICFPLIEGGESIEALLLKKDREFFSEEVIKESFQAIKKAKYLSGLIVVKASHSKTRSICNQLFSQRCWGNGKMAALLILSGDGETNYFGEGSFVKKLVEKFPKRSWSGGSGSTIMTPKGREFWEKNGKYVPTSGFFGSSQRQKRIADFVVKKHDPEYWEKNKNLFQKFMDFLSKKFS